jgi:hypothetical protein
VTDGAKQDATQEDLLIGVTRAVLAILMELTAQGALKREPAIRSFRTIGEAYGMDDATSEATRAFMFHMADLLEADPSRPPPAPVVPFRRR